MPPLLGTSDCIRSTCSTLKSNLKFQYVLLMNEGNIRKQKCFGFQSKVIRINIMIDNADITSEPKSRVFMSPAQGP